MFPSMFCASINNATTLSHCSLGPPCGASPKSEHLYSYTPSMHAHNTSPTILTTLCSSPLTNHNSGDSTAMHVTPLEDPHMTGVTALMPYQLIAICCFTLSTFVSLTIASNNQVLAGTSSFVWWLWQFIFCLPAAVSWLIGAFVAGFICPQLDQSPLCSLPSGHL